MSKFKIKLDEKALHDLMNQASQDHGLEIDCPHCHQRIFVKSGECCPLCGGKITFGSDPYIPE